MKIFVSWSKQTSKLIAEELKHFLGMTLGNVNVWMSETDIQKGTRWGEQIAEALDTTKVGLIVCTKGNLREPWLHFEAGALAKTRDSQIHPICFGIEKKDLQGALPLFQATIFEHDDIYELLAQLNDDNDVRLRSRELEARFERAWPQLQDRVTAAIAAQPTTPQTGETQPSEIPAPLPYPSTVTLPIEEPEPVSAGSSYPSGIDITEEEKAFLVAVARKGDGASVFEAALEAKISPPRARYHAEQLAALGWLECIDDGDGDIYLRFTPGGRQQMIFNKWDR